MDLFSIGVLDEDVRCFESYGAGVLIEGCTLRGPIAIVPNQECFGLFPRAVCYTAKEAQYLLNSSDKEAKTFHEMKRRFGAVMRQ